jgi:hypothetical protein
MPTTLLCFRSLRKWEDKNDLSFTPCKCCLSVVSSNVLVLLWKGVCYTRDDWSLRKSFLFMVKHFLYLYNEINQVKFAHIWNCVTAILSFVVTYLLYIVLQSKFFRGQRNTLEQTFNFHHNVLWNKFSTSIDYGKLMWSHSFTLYLRSKRYKKNYKFVPWWIGKNETQ